MDDINEIDLRRVDLNLLVVFAALMQERSVRRAAKRLLLGPSAVSMALGRLREMFEDPLLVRDRGAMAPTPRAVTLHARLQPALRELRGVVFDETSFDPSRARRTIRFASPDDLEIALLPRLIALVRREAPGITLVVRPSDFRIVPGMLDDGDADVALTATPAPLDRRHRQEVLYEEHFDALFDPKQLVAPRLTMKRYLETPHLLVSPSGVLRGLVDGRLAELGEERRVVAAVAHFSTLPFLLRMKPVLANVPSVAAHAYAREFRLAARPLPFDSPRFDVALMWHVRQDGDPALDWFRAKLRTLVLALRAESKASTPTKSTKPRKA
jgi:LysR family transcriptional regulator, mexEF-oprN operon transcriptional activator